MLNSAYRTAECCLFQAVYIPLLLLLSATRRLERREWQACVKRFATFYLPYWAHQAASMRMLAARSMLATLRAEGGWPLLGANKLLGLVLYTTGTVPNIGMAMGLRVRLWLQVLMQVATMATTLPLTKKLCSSSGSRTPPPSSSWLLPTRPSTCCR